MSTLTQEQIDALNNFARTHPHLAKVFDYLASGSKEGLGDALNDEGSAGITVAQSDDEASFSGITTIKFESANFYITQNDPNTDEVQVNFRGTASGGGSGGGIVGITVTDGTITLLDDIISFNDNDFYLTKDSSGNPTVNLRNDNTWALHGHFVDVPFETVALEEYVPIQQTILRFVGRTSKGSLAVVLRVNDDHQVTWASGSGAFHKVYFYPIQSTYEAVGSNVAQVGSRMRMDFYSISSDVKNFSWTLTGTEQF